MWRVDELTRFAERARDGDRRALELLAAGCFEDVWRLCAALVDAHAADDLTQETLVRLVAAVRHFRGQSSARTWALAIARRVCMDELRARERHRRGQPAALEPQTPACAPTGTVEVRDLLARLEPERRAAFALTQLLGLSYQQAAAVCQCPIGTIRSRVARAREDLIALLEASSAARLKASANRTRPLANRASNRVGDKHAR